MSDTQHNTHAARHAATVLARAARAYERTANRLDYDDSTVAYHDYMKAQRKMQRAQQTAEYMFATE